MKSLKVLVAAAACLVSLVVVAGPAPWYEWESKLNGKIICKQTSPGDGWVRASGPYKDSRCGK